MNIREIVLATRNKHKVEEIRDLLKGIPVSIRSVGEFPDVAEVDEDGTTLEQNAVKKAESVARATGRWALADDTGLAVDALGGEPGVYSARWAGPGCTYADNNKKLLRLLEGVPAGKRAARFSCVIALSDPDGKVQTVEGSIDGFIATSLKGENGFGYDPVFVVPEYGKTFAELSSDEKNAVSHRGRALRKARALIEKIVAD